MSPCIVIDFFLNKQQDSLIIQIIFSYKTPHVSGILSAHHQGFSTVHSALISFMRVFDDRLCLETVIKNLHDIYQWQMYSRPVPVAERSKA